MHAFRSYIFAARIACDSGPTCNYCVKKFLYVNWLCLLMLGGQTMTLYMRPANVLSPSLPRHSSFFAFNSSRNVSRQQYAATPTLHDLESSPFLCISFSTFTSPPVFSTMRFSVSSQLGEWPWLVHFEDCCYWNISAWVIQFNFQHIVVVRDPQLQTVFIYAVLQDGWWWPEHMLSVPVFHNLKASLIFTPINTLLDIFNPPLSSNRSSVTYNILLQRTVFAHMSIITYLLSLYALYLFSPR